MLDLVHSHDTLKTPIRRISWLSTGFSILALLAIGLVPGSITAQEKLVYQDELMGWPLQRSAGWSGKQYSAKRQWPLDI